MKIIANIIFGVALAFAVACIVIIGRFVFFGQGTDPEMVRVFIGVIATYLLLMLGFALSDMEKKR